MEYSLTVLVPGITSISELVLILVVMEYSLTRYDGYCQEDRRAS